MMRLRPLDTVECIDDTPLHKESTMMPRAGERYRVASVHAAGEGYSVRLMEITPACYLGGACRCGECGWDARRFRKIEPDEVAAVERGILQKA